MKYVIPALALLLLMLAGVALSACGQTPATPAPATLAPTPSPTPGLQSNVGVGGYATLSTEQLRTMLESKDFVLVNVHIPYEGEIPQTDVFAPYDRIERHLSQLPRDKGAKIVLYCRFGPMSEYAANTLVSLGFSNVYILDGGFAEWETEGGDTADTTASIASPRIYFEVDSIDLGKVPIALMEDTTFTFANTGDGPLEIRSVRAAALEGC
jgi:rhodanese-related sulfurtransferase